MMDILSKNFKIESVTKGGNISYMRVFPNKVEGKELFIYDEDNFDTKYAPIDDETRMVFKINNIKEEDETFLLEVLGEKVEVFYSIDTEDELIYYDDIINLVADYDIQVNILALREEILDKGFSVITPENYIISGEMMTRIQFEEIEEIM